MTTPDYPATVAEVLDPTMRFRRATVKAVMDFKGSRPWSGSLSERKAKFERLHAELCRVYRKATTLTFDVSDVVDGGLSAGVYYVPPIDEIVLVNTLSVVTHLHEFAHALGKGERGACKWSINLFRKCFPREFLRCRRQGHMLRRRSSACPRPPLESFL